MADLRTGWSGEAADAALSKFAPFQEWAAAAALLAGETAGKAQVQSGSYTVATLAMPSLAEIAAVQAAKVAAYSIGGALVGGAAAAEAAEEALKIRAAVTMETYDAATAHLAVQQNFDSPPSIAEPTAGASASAESPGSAARQSVVQAASTLADAIADPVRAATAAVASVVSNRYLPPLPHRPVPSPVELPPQPAPPPPQSQAPPVPHQLSRRQEHDSPDSAAQDSALPHHHCSAPRRQARHRHRSAQHPRLQESEQSRARRRAAAPAGMLFLIPPPARAPRARTP